MLIHEWVIEQVFGPTPKGMLYKVRCTRCGDIAEALFELGEHRPECPAERRDPGSGPKEGEDMSVAQCCENCDAWIFVGVYGIAYGDCRASHSVRPSGLSSTMNVWGNWWCREWRRSPALPEDVQPVHPHLAKKGAP